MNFKLITTVLIMGLSLQSCSFFEKSECNNPQVIDSVKQLYVAQININPLDKLSKFAQKINPNADIAPEKTITFDKIELKQIKQLNIEKLQANHSAQESQGLLELTHDRFDGAQIICQGILQQEIKTNRLAEITKELSGEDSKLIQGNKLNIPVAYALYKRDGSEQFDVQYSPQNPLHLILAMMLQKKPDNSSE